MKYEVEQKEQVVKDLDEQILGWNLLQNTSPIFQNILMQWFYANCKNSFAKIDENVLKTKNDSSSKIKSQFNVLFRNHHHFKNKLYIFKTFF